MKPLPSNAQIQKLITTHPDGVSGPPLAVAWSTHHPDTLVIIDTVGHKLIFPGMSLRGSEATAAISPTAPKEAPNKQGEKPPAATKKTGENQLRSTNKKEPGSPKPTNKPEHPKPVGARPASPASKSKSKPSPSGRGQGEGAGQGEGSQ